MTTERELFEAILENPEDLTLRLVYADWCDERGDARGEFIRIQCELAGQTGPSNANRSLRRREAELLEDHRRKWNGEIHRRLAQTSLCNRIHSRRGAIRRWEYRRGFVEFLVLEANTLLDLSDEFFKIGPVNELEIVQIGDRMNKVLYCPSLGRMKSVELVLPHLRRDQAEDRIAIQRPRSLNHVEIRPVNCQPGRDGGASAFTRGLTRQALSAANRPVHSFRRISSNPAPIRQSQIDWGTLTRNVIYEAELGLFCTIFVTAVTIFGVLLGIGTMLSNGTIPPN